MRVIFHLGAHRSATTSLQHYLRLQSPLLARRGIGFWGPQRLRNEGLFAGLYAGPSGRVSEAAVRAARPRIARALAMARARGMHTLVISEENAIGSVRGNIRAGALYPEVQSRLQGFARALGSPVHTVMLGVRPLSDYWRSALAYGVKRGAALPDAQRLEKISANARSWQDVASDLASVFPAAEIELHPYEDFAQCPEQRLGLVLGEEGCFDALETPLRLNAAPDLDSLRRSLRRRGEDPRALPATKGAWQPFSAAQLAALDERFADDVFWGLARPNSRTRWINRKAPKEAGISLTLAKERGHTNDQARRLGQAS
jgi:hypothetical protein